MSQTASVYVIADDAGHLKIGISSNPSSRLASFETGNPHNLRLAYLHGPHDRAEASRIERNAHSLLREDNVRNEWFRCGVAAAIRAIRWSEEF